MSHPVNAIVGFLDRITGRVTMYRLVWLILGCFAVVAFGLSLLDEITYTPRQMVLSLAVLLVVTYGTGLLAGAVFRVGVHPESSLITAGLLYFLLMPTDKPGGLLMLAIAAVLATLSKYLLAFRGRHIFNPAAAGVVLVYLFGCAVSAIWPDSGTVFPLTIAIWWIASKAMFPVIVLGTFLVLFRTRKLAIGLTFIVLGLLLVIWYLMDGGQTFGSAVSTALFSYPIIFLAGFMLTEPLTLPPLRWQQYLVAVVVALVMAYPLFFHPIRLGTVFLLSGPEWALLVGNIFAFVWGQQKGIQLTFRGRRQLTPTTYEFEFECRHPVTIRPGQYMELTLPHGKADARGIRRVFSLTSNPQENRTVRFGVKIADKSSTFKTAFSNLNPGDRVSATGVAGDFLLPPDVRQPLLLIAGGIGITPYICHLTDLAAQQGTPRDVMVVYGVNDPAEIAYAEELSQLNVPVLLVSPTRPASLPQHWTFAVGNYVTAEHLTEQVPNLSGRIAYVSGPPVMVNALTKVLRGLGVSRIRTDRFTGY